MAENRNFPCKIGRPSETGGSAHSTANTAVAWNSISSEVNSLFSEWSKCPNVSNVAKWFEFIQKINVPFFNFQIGAAQLPWFR